MEASESPPRACFSPTPVVLLKQDAGSSRFEEEGGSLKAASRVGQGVSRPPEPLRVGAGWGGGDSQARLTGSSRWLPVVRAGAGLLAPGRRGSHLPLRSGPQTPGSGRPGLSAEESGCSGCKPEDSGGLKFYCRKRGEVRKQ